MPEVSLADAYAEACRALGESVVTQRLLIAEQQKREKQLVDELTEAKLAAVAPTAAD